MCSHLTNPISDTIAFCAIIVPHCVQAESPRDESETEKRTRTAAATAAAAAVSATPSVPSSRPSSARLSSPCSHGPAHQSCFFLTRVDVRGAAIGTLHGGRNLNGRGEGKGRQRARWSGAKRCGVECPLRCRCDEKKWVSESVEFVRGCDRQRRRAEWASGAAEGFFRGFFSLGSTQPTRRQRRRWKGGSGEQTWEREEGDGGCGE